MFWQLLSCTLRTTATSAMEYVSTMSARCNCSCSCRPFHHDSGMISAFWSSAAAASIRDIQPAIQMLQSHEEHRYSITTQNPLPERLELRKHAQHAVQYDNRTTGLPSFRLPPRCASVNSGLGNFCGRFRLDALPASPCQALQVATWRSLAKHNDSSFDQLGVGALLPPILESCDSDRGPEHLFEQSKTAAG